MVFKETMTVLRISSSRSSNVYLCVMVASAVAVEIFAVQLMDILSQFYMAVSSNDTELFVKTLLRALVVTSCIALFKALTLYSADYLALEWRKKLITYLHELYVNDKTAYVILVGNGSNHMDTSFMNDTKSIGKDGTTSHQSICKEESSNQGTAIENPDQRITQDVERFCHQTSLLFSTILITPGLILFYGIYLYQLFGFIAPLSCVLYFLLSALITIIFSRSLAQTIYNQELLEGNLRLQHAQYRHNIEAIALLHGSVYEFKYLQHAFQELYINQQKLIQLKLPLYILTNWFSYFGAIVNYSVIGISILYMNQHMHSTTSSERAALMAKGSYACLYLISAFTTILTSTELITEVLGIIVIYIYTYIMMYMYLYVFRIYKAYY